MSISENGSSAGARLTLTLLQSDKADSAASRIRAALASVATAIGAINGNATRRATLAAENVNLQQQVADLQRQVVQSAIDLTAAKARLEEHQMPNPPSPDLEAVHQAKIAAIEAKLAGLQQSIALNQSQSTSNRAEIDALQASFLVGFSSVASSIVQRLSEQQQIAATHNQTVIAAVQAIYDDLRDFLDNAQTAEVLRLVPQEPPRKHPVLDSDANAARQEGDTIERRASDRISVSRSTGKHAQDNALATDAMKRADELAGDLDLLWKRLVKPLTVPPGNSLTVASLRDFEAIARLQDMESPLRWRRTTPV